MILTDEQKEFLENTNLPLLLLLEAEELNSDSEPDASEAADKDHESDESDESDKNGEDNNESESQENEMTEEDIFNAEIAGTEDKFIQFVLYDKLIEMASKIEILQDNIKNDKSAERMELIASLNHYSQYINVLNELIFSVSTSVIYKLLGQIELELIDLLQVYNASLERKNI